MPKHRPIKFETTLEPSLRKYLVNIIRENKTAKSAFNATLAIIAVGGILTIGAMAPAAAGMFAKILKEQKQKHREAYNKIWKNFYSLKKKGTLEFVREENDCSVYRLTNKGKEKIKKMIFDEIAIQKPKQWNNKWTLVIFDIPEALKKKRAAFRQKLKEMEFYQCQKSVWIHPFPCLEEIEFLKATLNIKPFVKLFIIDEMTDGKVLYHFRDLIKSAV